jgi:hypothetical protein
MTFYMQACNAVNILDRAPNVGQVRESRREKYDGGQTRVTEKRQA